MASGDHEQLKVLLEQHSKFNLNESSNPLGVHNDIIQFMFETKNVGFPFKSKEPDYIKTFMLLKQYGFDINHPISEWDKTTYLDKCKKYENAQHSFSSRIIFFFKPANPLYRKILDAINSVFGNQNDILLRASNMN